MCDRRKSGKGRYTKGGGDGISEVQVGASNHGEKKGRKTGGKKGNVDGGWQAEVRVDERE